MAFHSFEFVFGALPLIFLGFAIAHRLGGWLTAFRFLAAASLAFYAQFSFWLLAVLLGSVVFNYLAGEGIMKWRDNRRAAGIILLTAIAANVCALGYFKYTNFLIDIANTAFGAGFSHAKIMLPVGVSFFTFIQIGYLIECYNGQVERPGFSGYVLFATFFPCVTAGPLVLQREMFDQMRDRKDHAVDTQRIAAGLTIFCIGLFKKVMIADALVPYTDPVFDGVAAGMAVSSVVAWVGALTYTLQLYFDFSGYSDMALGLGCMFGLKLPLNFNSPFKQTNIADFWRCWHMTMTRFFTTFIYTPLAMRGMRRALGGNSSRVMRFIRVGAVPAVVTFFVAGIWHGSGMTFVLYGILHGAAIAVNLAWREFSSIRMPAVVGWALTMAVVVSGLVIFRAPDVATAYKILAAMWTGSMPVGPTSTVIIDTRTAMALILLLGSVLLLMPNSQTMLGRAWPSSDPMPADVDHQAGLLVWRPTIPVAFFTAAVCFAAIASIGATSTFLYYQF